MQLFIVIPSPHPTGPIKGAYALANALVDQVPVTLVTLRAGPGAEARVDDRVQQRTLAEISGGWWPQVAAYRRMLEDAGGRKHAASISMCFSADMVNCASGAQAVTCASVRGNLMKNYRLDYGLPGIPLAIGHLAALRKADHIVAITATMARQIATYAGKTPTVIGNFIDEAALDPYRVSAPRDGPFRFVYVASVTTRKQPLVALEAIRQLRRRGLGVRLELVGTGSIQAKVDRAVDEMGLRDAVTMHGHVASPYRIIAEADAMVLPSLSEGLARSALEALYLGVPCVLRDVDGNAELIHNPASGALFRDNRQLSELMLAVAERSRAHTGPRANLLPDGFRQREQARRYLDLVERSS